MQNISFIKQNVNAFKNMSLETEEGIYMNLMILI